MTKRALFVIDWNRFIEPCRTWIITQADNYDEFIFIIEDACLLQQEYPGREPVALLARIHAFLHDFITRPYYVLPVPARGVLPPHSWLRWRVLCPAFQEVFIDNPDLQKAMEQVLRVRVTVIAEVTGSYIPVKPDLCDKKRGLFITRAQPFHNGHLAFIEQMKAEVEELIVVIAMANRSHQLTDIATGGERLAMVAPVLQQVAPSRHYLVALPYSDFTMENIYELECLLPAFSYVYTTNPSVAVMAATAGYEVKGLEARLAVSSTLVRDCMVKELPYNTYVPESVWRFIQEHGLDKRLQQLHQKENRE